MLNVTERRHYACFTFFAFDAPKFLNFSAVDLYCFGKKIEVILKNDFFLNVSVQQLLTEYSLESLSGLLQGGQRSHTLEEHVMRVSREGKLMVAAQ